MLKTERQDFVLQKVNQSGKVIVSELTDELGVTEDTIRKDLQELSKQGLIKRVHGGAIRIDSSVLHFEKRVQRNSTRKEELGKLTVQLLKKDQVIFIDSSTTNLSFSNEIPLSYFGTIVTNSPSIALNLIYHPNVTIRLLPGELNKQSNVISGSDTIEAIKQINFDLCVLGVSSIDIDQGITVPMMEEAQLKKKAIMNSSHVISIITEEKFGTVSTYFVDRAQSLDSIVTEKSVSKKIISKYEKLGIHILV